MQTTDLSFRLFLRNAPQLVLPIYPRRYRWTAQHCERLVLDALRAGADPEIRSHCAGMITTRGAASFQRTPALSAHHRGRPAANRHTLDAARRFSLGACPGKRRARPRSGPDRSRFPR